MPMLAAIAIPSSALRAKDVVISWSPLKLLKRWPFRLRNAAASGGRCRRTVKPGRQPCLGLEGARRLLIWTVRRCFLHKGVLLGLARLQPAFIRPWPDLDCPPPELPADARSQENAVDRHAAAGSERAAALHVFRRAVRAFLQ